MRMTLGWVVFGLVVWSGVAAASADGPSFDCAKADGAVEEMICTDPELATLDRQLAEVYGQAVAAIEALDAPGDSLAELRSYQRGWIKGRNECWKADDQQACVAAAYEQRIATLQTEWNLVQHGEPVFYTCNDNPADEIVATFYEAALPTVRLERGDTTEIGLQQPAASGARYAAPFGIVFWIKGQEAQVTWPEGTSFTCRVR
jgi:uncharacterized protein